MNLCPSYLSRYPEIVMGHGGGGRLTQQLIHSVFAPLMNAELKKAHDGARITLNTKNLVVSTDAFVVTPIEFKGGDIAKLAICGGVNDVAMCGARPIGINLSFILEEGLSIELLAKLTSSMAHTLQEAGICVLSADTKVVERGHGDKVFISTTTLGEPMGDVEVGPMAIEENDVVILSGDIGRHGIALMSERKGFAIEGAQLSSDCTLLSPVIEEIYRSGISPHCLRDLTRGGFATAMVEIAEKRGCQIEIQESAIPQNPQVQDVCEVLGLNFLEAACEGRFVAFVQAGDASEFLKICKSFEITKEAVLIGSVSRILPEGRLGRVQMKNDFGTTRILEMPSGLQLPRIC